MSPLVRFLRSSAPALVAASFLAFFEIYRVTVTRVLEGRPISHADFFFMIPLWTTVVILSPWCAWMARRFPFHAGGFWRAFGAHLLGGCLFVAAQMAMLITLHMGLHHAEPLWGGMVHRFFFYAAMELSVYAAIVLVVLTLDARREAAERRVAAARLEQSLTTAKLESLQAQIRPHFLFNTLNALAVLSRRGDGAAVDRAIGDLGELLRASFAAPGRHEIPLGEELEFLERYLGLQRIRFPDRLEVEWRVEDAARSALVPALLVQPLVENALEHGLARTAGGRVRIAARREGGSLAIEVADDGPGFARGGAAAGVRTGTGADAGASNGVGLANVRERLAILYGAAGTLTLGDGPDGGGTATVRLPWREARA
jgi:signal transduction histidine kinase